jgi:putative hydrolase of the HAD superfamily
MSIRAVSLDVGWTLAYPRASMWEIFADLCTEAGAPTTALACEQVVRGLWTFAQTRAEEHFHGGAEYTDSDLEFAAQFGNLGRLIFGQLGIAENHERLMERFLERFWTDENWLIFPDVLPSLQHLREQGVRIGVLSNAPSDMPKLLDRLGISPFLDYTVVSATEGYKKPDRRVFEIAVRRAGVEPNEVLHVGDMYVEDIVGGRAAGLHTMLMERGPRALFPSFRESEGRNLPERQIVDGLAAVIERLRA